MTRLPLTGPVALRTAIEHARHEPAAAPESADRRETGTAGSSLDYADETAAAEARVKAWLATRPGWEAMSARVRYAAARQGCGMNYAWLAGAWMEQAQQLHERLRRFEAASRFVLEVTGGSKDWHGDTREMLLRLEGLLDARDTNQLTENHRP